MKLTNDDVKTYRDALKEVKKLDNKIAGRVDEILNMMHRAFGIKWNGWWWFPNAMEGEKGTIEQDTFFTNNNWEPIGFEVNDPVFMGTEAWDYGESFPRKWLFLPNRTVQSEIDEAAREYKEAGRKEKEEEQRKKKEQKKLSSSKYRKLRKDALAKLTVEEANALCR